MRKNIIIAFAFYVTSIVCSNEVSALDYTDPESVAMVFLDAIKNDNYEIIPSIVAPAHQHRFTPEAIKKELGTMTIPDNLELKVRYQRIGPIQKAVVKVVGTKISLELRPIDGKWLLEP
ncbi:MAG: hypothetical protein IIA06_06190 [Proteobacteria bacterium]|nr:hypothetical protein [Pseudomonadota bacterium]